MGKFFNELVSKPPKISMNLIQRKKWVQEFSSFILDADSNMQNNRGVVYQRLDEGMRS